MKIVTILGARPQFIKAGSVSRAIKSFNYKENLVEEIIIHTGQHYDENMSDVFFKEMHIPKPDYSLGIGGNSHGAMTGQMIEAIEEILIKENPDWVLVYGDTNSTISGALAAAKLHIKIAHVEAGLRSFNIKMPEEVNRILTDRISTVLFCPTVESMNHLNNEGISTWSGLPHCLLVGDVMQDGAFYYSDLAKKPVNFIIKDEFVLCTIHRAENTDNINRLESIINALNVIAKDKQIILPLHPRTKKIVEQNNIDVSNLTIIEPVGYLNMIWLIKHAECILTDSGGLQKEAFFFEKPCITMRDETEWTELLEAGVNTLVGASELKIIEAYNEALTKGKLYDQSLYGNGEASKKIIEKLFKLT